MQQNAQRIKAFDVAAQPADAEIINHPLREEAEARIRAHAEESAKAQRGTNEEIRLKQYARQCEMLRDNLAQAAAMVAPEDLIKQNQAERYTPVQQDTVARQAMQQENGGSIFSSAYSRFHFV